MNIHSGSTYKLTNAKSGTVLDLSRMGHTVVMGYKWHGGANQKWVLEQHKNGLWTICNTADNKYLGLKGGLHKEGTPVVGVDESVYWDIRGKDGEYRIFVPGESLNLDLAGSGDSRNGVLVQIWNKWKPGENQKWILYEEPNIKSGSTYSFTNAKSGTVLDLSRSSGHAIGYKWHGGANQKWTLQQHKNGLWTIRNTANQKYLGIEGGLHKDGISIVGVTEAVYWVIKRDANNRGKYSLNDPMLMCLWPDIRSREEF